MSEAPQIVNALSQAEIDAIEAEIRHLPDRQSAAIEALQIVQAARGWVSDESLEAAAKLLDMSSAELDSIATFYNLIYRQPVGKNVVMVCDSISCFVMHGEKLRDRVQQHLNVGMGETTADDLFTLLPIVCLGACDRAPVMMVGDQLFGGAEVDDLAALFARFRP
ncbi:MAG: NADH-quinone oxidoreductase subunit NuoE [Pseudomonadales bacterium]